MSMSTASSNCARPSSKVIFRPLGTYTVTLKNPDFPDYQETLVFREADPVREIRVDLAERHSHSVKILTSAILQPRNVFAHPTATSPLNYQNL